MDWEVVIGLETHAQLSTKSKIFSGASTQFSAAPNMQACAVDLALPGALPVTNRVAVERAILFGLAINATIAPRSVFSRKHYFYPDSPKGYQISQYELPVIRGGLIIIRVEVNEKSRPNVYKKSIKLIRAHLEEDAGKSLHKDFTGMTGIDLNRAGIPLLEIVTEPDMRSAAEAVAYAKTLHSLVVWLNICDGNMQEGSFRFDANVSVRRLGDQAFGTRTEIKNLNSFRFLEEAIQYEVCRQIRLIQNGGIVVQETRLYDSNRGETQAMRHKEDAHDYRYLPDPDLIPLIINKDWVDKVRRFLPELPDAMRCRFTKQYSLLRHEADALTTSQAFAEYYEQVVSKVGITNAKMVANWMIGGLASHLNRDRLSIGETRVSAEQLALIILRIVDGTISNKIGKEIFGIIWDENASDNTAADRIINSKRFKQISDISSLEAILDTVIATNPKCVNEYLSGKNHAFNALVGQMMKATQGQANPQQVNELLKNKLSKHSK
ncbi:Asp-tRNA(Asn)/Glu-tRNA(Gln) amidotransferase subunit GatB [Candidatus Vallotia tarda]|uniref:Aspartyl/glutamyl-tRNA(Asn/Gln) amidotransferase subunit B n=1 Tax=Candidatus Vallotiella hemipterorum TaxID=1177213 RepID=A0A916NK08_9BURK|nr:Asp-tRNA(Asn)/Glu-tRNA(Gln) amidotransferase subunit GatB [Candidatus Vallotia tarda]CAG7595301.1 Aspartyl/glutamyl-tRNA(Asn/Gln) amidotransferasesubunit B [Candidatus Vallotia tarda]